MKRPDDSQLDWLITALSFALVLVVLGAILL